MASAGKPMVNAVKPETNGKRGKNDEPYNTIGIAGFCDLIS